MNSLLWGTENIVNYFQEKMGVRDGSVYILGCWNLVLYSELILLSNRHGLSCHAILKSSNSSHLMSLSEKNGWKQILEVWVNEKLNLNVIITQRRVVFISEKNIESACALVTEENKIIENLKDHFFVLQSQGFKINI
jgi:hypothetical protein